MSGVGNIRIAAALAAIGMGGLGSIGALGAQDLRPAAVYAPREFSSRHGGGKGKGRSKHAPNRRWRSAPPHGCTNERALRYRRQIRAAAFNFHFDKRMAWNETTYPRVREQQLRSQR